MLQLKLAKEKIINFFQAQKHCHLSQEAFIAYFNKLPKEIQVEWTRDGKFIVGKIMADGNEFMTQGESAEEFVDMVNDALFSVYNIPISYFSLLESRKFKPTQKQFEQLGNVVYKKSQMSWQNELATA
ncbi:MAG: hypothetical protein A2821_04190 [Candidatus Magasanikbacteria bacterium RIFCSPHIGHO2_01_FULL_41_23]|uniref:Uncharacterized protein n=1 Tax=Candidatus Magasanikbacteria bacterium RIFCSPLOWO2_01_FULL_40_15 TaxID=1798686 RepID=A0A1F6N3U4_9BACT|nr:MAG: hypothetical protein A2821_04190 [Candidatus Magasanikbacteria bacterium RIFCSPHIGHO2_01_FULL_41_23]OGH67129.1 MAG: hypothetical protein A3C66_02505 [Candidatus Magasanikbacteria bacterium RIFCSPHIGHO2_02_FULL_41_35]OGH76717.1 MAG: hypothetical protein A3F22_03365 [Candidatus Magasanikbacteria bacterium RIFCSPHIGHO2_12_FULL_41_16]OGH78665.1 MAG: hypothetical protein A2983_04140 [Candidatus Magasanikbacteria bacterium RIFCSPLOWO2_01_FULL_40_15]